jgi:ketosteroid isomerase-like protein
MTGQAFDPGSAVDYAWAGQFLEQYVAALTEGNISPFVDLFAEDATLQPGPFDAPLQGTNSIRAYFLQRAETQADLELTVERHWVSGATILAAWHASYLQRPDRGHARSAGFLTAEIRSGRCTRLRIWTETKAGGS